MELDFDGIRSEFWQDHHRKPQVLQLLSGRTELQQTNLSNW